MSKQEVFAAQSSFEAALSAYEAFRNDTDEKSQSVKDIIEEHDHLAVALAEALEGLKTALRENHTLFGSQFGGFKVTIPRSYDYEALRDALGEDGAEPFTKTTHAVDSKVFEEAVKAGQVDQSVAEKVIGSGTPRISGGPKPPTIFQR